MQHRINRLTSTAHHHRQVQRQQINQMLILAEYLPDADRVLIEQHLGQGHSVSRLARLSGVPARQMHRRVNSITKRLSKKLFKDVSTQFNLLPKEARPIAKLVVFHGMSMRKAAITSGLTLHQIRKQMNTVHATARLFQ